MSLKTSNMFQENEKPTVAFRQYYTIYVGHEQNVLE